MRTIRNDVGKKFRNMNFEELRNYIDSELKKIHRLFLINKVQHK